MNWRSRLEQQLTADRQAVREGTSPFVIHQQERFGLSGERVRLPEHFRGPLEAAEVCFLGPHVVLESAEEAPTVANSLEEYLGYYQERTERRDPYGHYQAIMGGRPWVATELVHWPCEKDLALQVLKSPAGPGLVDEGLSLTWALLAASPVRTLVLTGNDALKWVLPRLGWSGGKLPGVTQLHGQVMGDFDLPGYPGRRLRVVASFHWSPEMPMFVRKLSGMEGLKVSEAISAARRRVAEQC